MNDNIDSQTEYPSGWEFKATDNVTEICVYNKQNVFMLLCGY